MDIKDFHNKFEIFSKCIEDQFKYGGKKYASTSETKEATDILFDTFGHSWLVGTMCKYVFRYRNLARSRDMFKIATYCYLVYLKRGFHWVPNGITHPPIDTNIKIKEQYFNDFINTVTKGIKELEEDIQTHILSREEILNNIQSQLIEWSKNAFSNIKKEDIFLIFIYTYLEWYKSYGHLPIEQQDKDTNNETKT